MREHNLLQRREPRKAELRQMKRLYDLMPQVPNELWQMDFTYIYMPQGTWWYTVTVIDYHSRRLLVREPTLITERTSPRASFNGPSKPWTTTFASAIARLLRSRTEVACLVQKVGHTVESGRLRCRRCLTTPRAWRSHVRKNQRYTVEYEILEWSCF